MIMIPAKPFYLIRHAESTANAASIAAGGELDSPLTDRGKEQATALAPYLGTVFPPPNRLYHSPMTRVIQTAKLISREIDLEMTSVENLREHKMGEWNGRPWEEVLPKIEAKETPPGGESEEVFVNRVQSAFTEIL